MTEGGLAGMKRLRGESDLQDREAVMGAIMMQDREEENVDESYDDQEDIDAGLKMIDTTDG